MYICSALLIKQVTIMNTDLSFETAMDVLSPFCIVSYSSVITKCTILEVFSLSIYEMRQLCLFGNWYVGTNLINSHVQVVLMND